MARMINTVTGPVSSDALGGVLAHEHIVFGYPGYAGDVSFDAFDREEFLSRMCQIANTIKAQGIGTVVDATPNECGRDVELLRDVSRATGLNVICSTGYYGEGEGATAYFKFRAGVGCNIEEEAYEIFQRELTEGVGKTGIKPGVIKLASGEGEITDYEQAFFGAACRYAAENPDARIITHTSVGTCLEEQADYFIRHGVRPQQVQIGHVCGCTDLAAQRKVLEKGFYVAYDRIGLEIPMMGMPDDSVRFDNLSQLIFDGFGDQIMISFDKMQHILGRSFEAIQKAMYPMMKNQSWERAVDYVLPSLMERGVSEAQAHHLLFENPAAFYGG